MTPSIDRTLHQFLTITDLDLITEFDFYLIVQGFHRTYATGAACQQRTLTPPDTWSCPTLGLACVLMSRPISPELVLSPDFWISNTPRYFSFASKTSVAQNCAAFLVWWCYWWLTTQFSLRRPVLMDILLKHLPKKDLIFIQGRNNFKSEVNTWVFIGPSYQGFFVVTWELKKSRNLSAYGCYFRK